MKQNFNAALGFLLQHEGGFVVNPQDPGGMTNLGVTMATWQQYVGHPVTGADMRNLTLTNVSPLYHDCYWRVVQGDDLPSGLDYAVFDCAVNSGTPKAIRIFQSILGVKTDGVMGSKTIAALSGKSTTDLINQYCDERLRFLRALPTWADFGAGWGRRIEEVRAQALTLA